MRQNGKEINPYTHFYLYARGWYARSERLLDDLKTIAGHFSGIHPRYISKSDILNHMTHLAFVEINRSGNPEYNFSNLVIQASNENALQACLSMLRYVEVSGLNLGEPDYSILPKRTEE